MAYRENGRRVSMPPYRNAGRIRKALCRLGFHDLRWKTYDGEYVEHHDFGGSRGMEDVPHPTYGVNDVDVVCCVCKRWSKKVARSYSNDLLKKFVEPEWGQAGIMMYGWE